MLSGLDAEIFPTQKTFLYFLLATLNEDVVSDSIETTFFYVELPKKVLKSLRFHASRRAAT